MGRLDKFYCNNNISLGEEKDLSKQFKQVVAETGVDGPFRIFLEEHCTNDWQKIFRSDSEEIRQALKTAIPQPTFKEQVVTFIRGFEKKCSFSDVYIYTLPRESGEFPPGVAPLLTFAKDIANKVFPNNPLEFSRCFKDLNRLDKSKFLLSNAQWFYGKNFFLKPEFVRSMDEETVWRLFETLYCQETIHDVGAFGSYLKEWANTREKGKKLFSLTTGNFPSLQFIRTFLEIQIDRQTPKESFDSLNKIINQLQKSWFNLIDIEESYKWVEAVCREFEIFWCFNVSGKGVPFELEDEWAELYHKNFLFFVSEQSQAVIHAMIKWSLKKDLEKGTFEKRLFLLSEMTNSGKFAPLWYVSSYRNEWLKEFYRFLDALPIEQRCLVLSIPFGSSVKVDLDFIPDGISPSKPDDENHRTVGEYKLISYFYRVAEEDINNYDLYLKNLIEIKALPKDLYFKTAIKTIDRFYTQIKFSVNLSNTILGQLRGFVATDDVPVPFEELDSIWRTLERHDPQKALFHRLMLLRASSSLCCDENLEIKRSGPCPLTAREIIQRLSNIGKDDSMEARREDICRWFAEYCISRLLLRKKEKTGKDGYLNDQVMEISPVWREGYLNALSELGTDLGGRIHKIAYFIRKNDPDQEVRDAAAKCYKASRRKHIKDKDSFEIIRSLIAAYWWLLMAHIMTLGKEPDFEGALLTRRRQLRR